MLSGLRNAIQWPSPGSLVLMWLLIAQGYVGPESAVASSTVPPGFENLFKPAKTLMDVYYGGRMLPGQQITYTPDTVQFSQPEKLAQQIPGLSNQAAVVEALTGKLDAHADRACHYQGQPECGRLQPSVAGVIFNENRFRVDIFVNSDHLMVTPVDRHKYLPPSQAGMSLIQSLGVVASGTRGGDSEQDNYNLYGNSQLAFRENDLEMGWDYASTTHFTISTLQLQRELEGRRYQAGLVSTQGLFRFTTDQTLWGLRYSSSDSTRIDQGLTQGTPLEVFLPVRGRVDVLKDNRLIYSTLLEAGNRLLDTSSFPRGAYDVALRIRDEAGQLISETTRFFARQSELPPMGDPWYALEAGRLANTGADHVLPEAMAPWVTRGSVNVRLQDTLAGSLAVAAVPGESVLETGLFAMIRQWELSPGLMVASDGSKGARLNGFYRAELWSLSLDYRRLWRKDEPPESGSGYPSIHLLSEASEQASINVNIGLFGGNLSYRVASQKDDTQGRTNRHTTTFSRTMYRGNQFDIALRLDLSATGDDRIALINLDCRQRTDHWNFSVTPHYQRSRVDSEYWDGESSWRASARWDSRAQLEADLSAGINIDHRQTSDSLSMDVDYGTRLGRIDMTLSHIANRDAENTTSYVLSGATSFLSNGRDIAVGGDRVGRSGMVVQLHGAPDARFDVLVNGQRQGYAIGGKTSVILLPPFATYEVRLKALGEGFYDFTEMVREITLYPGNVMTLDYQVTALRIIYGQAIDSNGKPLAKTRITNAGGFSSTDEFGLFQVEVDNTVEALMLEKADGTLCRLSVTSQSGDSLILNLGRSQCQ
ncbi:TcfC E-set like domain-containing protein [Endozoicomonas sp.]|uniref:TcfC E-set like domain-containing protein n=1 Tax=Endozoicomonas sp. TaxID=1892382 RepID=UPI0028852279|nr:TcfC E-set like domain-containing protein [Endozoicomonas sp.]